MKTYIINLERSAQRRRHIISECRKYGLDFELVKAVDGRAFTEADIEKVADMDRVRAYPDWMTPTMIATVLSHRRVYERIIEVGDAAAFIVEDDVTFGSDPRPLLDAIKPLIREEEAVLLHYFSFEPLGISTASSKGVPGAGIVAFPMRLKGVVSAAAYVLSLSAARRLFRSTLPVSTASDAWTDFIDNRWLGSVRVVYPRPVEVIGAKSTISVASQSGLRAMFTETVDKYRIPILHHLLQRQRLRNLDAMSNFFLTEEPSTFQV